MTYSGEIEQLIQDSINAIQENRIPDAERDLKKAIALFSQDPEAELLCPEFAYLLILLATAYTRWEKTDKAETLYFKAIETLEQSVEPANKLLCKALNELAELYLAVNKLVQAAPLLERANTIAEEWLSKEDAESMFIMRNLSRVSFRLGKFTQAKNLAEKLLKTQETVFGSRHAEVSDTLELLGTINQSNRKYDAASAQYKRALSIQEGLYGSQSDGVARVLRKLASLHCDRHDHTLAKPLLKKALAIKKTLKRTQDEEYGYLYHQLAEVYYVECNYQPSELYFKKALAIRKRLIGSHCLEVADTLSGLGKLHCALKRYKEAEQSLNFTLQIQMDLLGPYNKEVASTLSKLAGVYMSQGRFNEANLMKDQAMTCQVQHMQLTVDDFDPYDRAVLYHSQGAYKEAEEFYHKALAKVERNLGTDHFRLAEILTKLAELHRSVERYDKAEMLLLQALKIFQRMQHRAVLTTYAVLADLYMFQERHREAEDIYVQALAMIEDAAGVRQSDQLSIMGGYEKLLSVTGRKAEADKIRTKLRAIRKKTKSYQAIIEKPVRPESV